MGIAHLYISYTGLGVAAGFQLVDVKSWSNTTPTGVPEGMTYGGYVIFKINNSGRYIGFLASAIGPTHHALGYGENLENIVWCKVAYQE